jgi:hypothetical protein
MSVPLLLDKYRANIVIGILYSGSGQDAAKKLEKAIKELKRKKLGTDIIISFIDKIINQLQRVYDMTSDTFKWSNISMAILTLTQIKAQLSI